MGIHSMAQNYTVILMEIKEVLSCSVVEGFFFFVIY